MDAHKKPPLILKKSEGTEKCNSHNCKAIQVNPIQCTYCHKYICNKHFNDWLDRLCFNLNCKRDNQYTILRLKKIEMQLKEILDNEKTIENNIKENTIKLDKCIEQTKESINNEPNEFLFNPNDAKNGEFEDEDKVGLKLFKCHPHYMCICETDRLTWSCQICKKQFKSVTKCSWYCTCCNYDICEECGYGL